MAMDGIAGVKLAAMDGPAAPQPAMAMDGIAGVKLAAMDGPAAVITA
jgi:hypothetical protein